MRARLASAAWMPTSEALVKSCARGRALTFPPGPSKSQDGAERSGAKMTAGKIGEILGGARRAVLAQVGRRGADHATHLTHAQGSERRIRELGDAHRQIEAFVDQIDHAVVQ